MSRGVRAASLGACAEHEQVHARAVGGDQARVVGGAFITEGKIDFLIFFWDPLEPQPHDPDVKALLRIALVWNIPTACNRATADFLISSMLMEKPYQRIVQDFTDYQQRRI